jgi:hypothetical protein
MSATELIEHVRALPLREREKFVLAVLALNQNRSATVGRKNKRVRWPDVEARARRIFGARVLPNLVLLERDETGR